MAKKRPGKIFQRRVKKIVEDYVSGARYTLDNVAVVVERIKLARTMPISGKTLPGTAIPLPNWDCAGLACLRMEVLKVLKGGLS